MTENEVKKELTKSFDDVKPIIQKMTNFIMDAYEIGFDAGFNLGKNLVK